MRDRWAIAWAVAAALGASRPSSVPLVVGALVSLLALRGRRPAVFALGVGLVASALAERAWDGLAPPEARVVEGEVLLVSDPEPRPGGLRADVRLGRQRLELRALGAVAESLRERSAGERLLLRGEVGPPPAGAVWLVPRHVRGVLLVHRVDGVLAAAPPLALANRVRAVLARGAEPLTPEQRALFTGLVIGDDRAQDPAQTDAFRGAGMTHLLAVSGQNVAFVLLLAGPLARRLRLWPRLVATVAIVGLFGLVTRFEPSVLRAAAMASVAAFATTIGTPMPRLRVLALAATGLLLVDPLLVHAVGFRLSVLAAAAIVLLTPRLAAVLPVPPWLAEPLGATIAAQLGVAPVLLATFGPVPVASFPANLLAVPAAGLVLVWGMTAGMVAGVLGGPVAEHAHLPTRVLLGWIEQVAERAAVAPLGELGTVHVVAISVGLSVAVVARVHGASFLVRRAGLALAGLATAAAVLVVHAPAPLRSAPGAGIVRWHAGGTDVVALGGGGWRSSLGIEPTLEALRRTGVGAIDVLVLVDDDVPGATVEAVVRRHPTAVLLAPRARDDLAQVVAVPPAGTDLVVGALVVTLVPGEQRLVVEARPVETSR